MGRLQRKEGRKEGTQHLCFRENQELNVAKATVKSLENTDLERNWFSLRKMLWYKCTQRFFKSVKFKKHIKSISNNGKWSHGG